MSQPDPIQYAERLYAAIRAANFSPISFLAFGNAVKEGIELRRMPRIAAEPFMRVVGEMLEFETEVAEADLVDPETIEKADPSLVLDPPVAALAVTATIDHEAATDAAHTTEESDGRAASRADNHR